MKIARILMGRLKKDDYLLEALYEIIEERKIKSGLIQGIGAVQNLNCGYYDQKNFKYKQISFNKPLEVTNLTGNISIKDEKPFIHCHITCADENGNVFGGHLGEKTKVFAFEYIIFIFEGKEFFRKFDSSTGLYLWEK